MGDPAGVGPEVALHAMADLEVREFCTPIVFGDLEVLDEVDRTTGLDRVAPGEVLDCGGIRPDQFVPGKTSAGTGAAAYGYVEHRRRLG